MNRKMTNHLILSEAHKTFKSCIQASFPAKRSQISVIFRSASVPRYIFTCLKLWVAFAGAGEEAQKE